MSRQRVVVVGAGMVGHRLVEELCGVAEVELHLVGEEEYEPYNRILLSEVVAGRQGLEALALPLPDPAVVRFHRGVAATMIDREARTVRLADGRQLHYDRLVLATGARAFVPPLPGLGPGLPRHVHALRTLDDCRDVAARSLNARHAVVLGGGVLGLEAACGLRRRGVPVTVLDLDAHPMAAQLDAGPAVALAGRLGDLGIEVRCGSSVAEVLTASGELVGVRLMDGVELPADLLVISCGIRAETTLARAAGLPVDRGVLVDASLTTADPRIHAIGDCAQPPEGGTGLLAPGWRQAERLAGDLAAAARGERRPRGAPAARHRADVRLKAAGVDLAVLGVRASAAGPDDRVVSVTDPAGRRHVDLVLRDDVLVGVTCLGMPEVVAATSVVLDRGTPAPVDPLALLVPAGRSEEPTPLRMPAGATVCRCNGVTKGDVVAAWEDGARSLEDMSARTRAATGCGGCRQLVCGLVDWLASADPDTPPPSQPADASAAALVARP